MATLHPYPIWLDHTEGAHRLCKSTPNLETYAISQGKKRKVKELYILKHGGEPSLLTIPVLQIEYAKHHSD